MNLLLSIGASLGSVIEKLESEKAKEESQRNFKQISDALEEVFWLFDIDESKFLLISRACFDVLDVYKRQLLRLFLWSMFLYPFSLRLVLVYCPM